MPRPFHEGLRRARRDGASVSATAGPDALGGRGRVVMLIGGGGQIGGALVPLLPALGQPVVVARTELDLARPETIASSVARWRPDIVINAAAYTAVDRAETDVDSAWAVNAHGPGVLAAAVARYGGLLVHYSTDYVFDGESDSPYDEDSATGPRNVYGKSKLAGEQAIRAAGVAAIILRTSWVYGLTGRNFLLTMRRLAQERDEIRVVDDQIGVPNWSEELAQASVRVLARETSELRDRAGIYHLTASGSTSWCGFARAIFAGRSLPRIVPIATAAYPTPAPRPRSSILDGTRLAERFGVRLPDWRECLRRCLATEG